ncbi:MAG TPA: hypothetical protein VIV60_31300 [Polyangiaceae bacterium]
MTSTEAKWRDRVLEWRTSGLSAEQFAQGKEYGARTLVWYRTQLRRKGLIEERLGERGAHGAIGKSAAPSSGKGAIAAAPKKLMGVAVAMAKVIRSTRAPSHAEAMIVEVGPARISIRAGFDAALLQQVVQALQGAA